MIAGASNAISVAFALRLETGAFSFSFHSFSLSMLLQGERVPGVSDSSQGLCFSATKTRNKKVIRPELHDGSNHLTGERGGAFVASLASTLSGLIALHPDCHRRPGQAERQGRYGQAVMYMCVAMHMCREHMPTMAHLTIEKICR